ncbi:MAG: hypothetical protein IT542_03010 [Rubellimicrobium sp.]|nr:hypothetical protein [Rubellimicrobium sp.]
MAGWVCSGTKAIPRLAAILAYALAGCVAEGASPDLGSDTDSARPVLSATERAECAAAGGRVGIAGLLGGEFCIRPAPDAGQACTRSSDCTAWCDAESRTCAPELNPYGCRSYLNEAGEAETICVD